MWSDAILSNKLLQQMICYFLLIALVELLSLKASASIIFLQAAFCHEQRPPSTRFNEL